MQKPSTDACITHTLHLHWLKYCGVAPQFPIVASPGLFFSSTPMFLIAEQGKVSNAQMPTLPSATTLQQQ